MLLTGWCPPGSAGQRLGPRPGCCAGRGGLPRCRPRDLRPRDPPLRDPRLTSRYARPCPGHRLFLPPVTSSPRPDGDQVQFPPPLSTPFSATPRRSSGGRPGHGGPAAVPRREAAVSRGGRGQPGSRRPLATGVRRHGGGGGGERSPPREEGCKAAGPAARPRPASILLQRHREPQARPPQAPAPNPPAPPAPGAPHPCGGRR